LEGRKFDLIVTSMVLHHVSSPTDILQVLSSLLKKGGYLAVIDFDAKQNPHALQSDEERRAKGVHHPHGFSVESMTNYFHDVGITLIAKDGFRISQELLCHHPEKDNQKFNDVDVSISTFLGITKD